MIGLCVCVYDLSGGPWMILEETQIVVFCFERAPFGVISSSNLPSMVIKLIWVKALQSSKNVCKCYYFSNLNSVTQHRWYEPE